MPRSAVRLLEVELEERRARDRERLKQAVEQLLSSDGWQQWVRARASNGLARYSVWNLCLIVLAKPEASFVAGFKAWLQLGYCVRKGEHAIRIFAPMTIKDRDAVTGEDTGRSKSCAGTRSSTSRPRVPRRRGGLGWRPRGRDSGSCGFGRRSGR